MKQVGLDIDGEKTQVSTKRNWTLLFMLREVLGLAGAKCRYSTGDYRTCKVIIDGEAVNSCLVLARNLEGKKTETIEGLSNGMDLHPIQQAFINAGTVQYGYCTSRMVMSAKVLLDRIENPAEEEVRNNDISNDLCRYTGYVKIVEAVRLVAGRMMEAKAGGKKEER